MEKRCLAKMSLMGVMVLFTILFLIFSLGYAEVGVTRDLIKIGTSQDLSGPSVFYGKGYLQGMNVFLKSINEQGGIHGRKIELVAYDDAYEPSRTVSNFKRLVYEDKVFCLLQIFGTPNTLALLPLIEQEKIPLIAPSTSAIQVAIPPKRYVFPVWPPLPYYGRLMIDYAVSDSKSNSPRVAGIYLDSEFGTQQVEGLMSRRKSTVLRYSIFNPSSLELLTIPPYSLE